MKYLSFIKSDLPEGISRQMHKTFIYVFVDPRDGRVRYVGKVKSPNERYQRHVKPGVLAKNFPVTRWAKKLLDQSVFPEMRLLECVADADYPEREKYWIAYYRALHDDLLNITDGGEGAAGYDRPEEVKAKISQTLTGHEVSQETRDLIAQNSRRPDAASKVRGISYSEGVGKWLAQGRFGGLRCHIGVSDTEQGAQELLDAALALPEAEALARYSSGARDLSALWTPEKRAALGAKKRGVKPRTQNASSRYHGVSRQKAGTSWQVYINDHGTRKYLGSFKTEDLAAEAYNVKALELGLPVNEIKNN